MKTHSSFAAARQEFERAWNAPHHTRIEPAPVDVNALLAEGPPPAGAQRFTREMLWDAEREKAWDPGSYIPGVVREGRSWGRTTLGGDEEQFLRASRQRAWKDGVPDGLVLEEVFLSPAEGSVLFFGRAGFVTPEGERLEAGSHQPLFHVEHAVMGTDERPLNRWRIVHLTQAEDPGLIQRQLDSEGDTAWVRGFLQAFLARHGRADTP